MSAWQDLDGRARVRRRVRSASRLASWWTFGIPITVVLVAVGTLIWSLAAPETMSDSWSFLRGMAIGVTAVGAVGAATLIQATLWHRYLVWLREAPSSVVDVVAWWLWLEYPEYGSKKSGLTSRKEGLRRAIYGRDSLLADLAMYGNHYSPSAVAITTSGVLHAYDMAASVSKSYAGLLAPLNSVRFYSSKSKGWRDLSRGYARVASLIERYREEPAMLALAAKFCETESRRDTYGSGIDIDERYDRVEKTLERVRRSG